MNEKLYVIVRKDLPIGLQMAQACHAARSFVPPPAPDENLVVLHAENEAHLRNLAVTAYLHGHQASTFEEPDLGMEATAAAIAGSAKPLLRGLPLAC